MRWEMAGRTGEEAGISFSGMGLVGGGDGVGDRLSQERPVAVVVVERWSSAAPVHWGGEHPTGGNGSVVVAGFLVSLCVCCRS